jgi:hypothetical protein
MFLTDFTYFGSISFVQHLLKQSQITFDTQAPFTKMSFKNRMVLTTSQGPLNLTIPIVGGRDQKAPIHEILIDYTSPWNEQHLKAIRTSYKRAPYFEYYEQSLELLYLNKQIKLIDFLFSCQFWLRDQLKAPWEIIPIIHESEQEAITNKDTITSGKYYSPWQPNNYELCTSLPNYQQVFLDKVGFIPNVCILDMLFCCGGKQVNKLLRTI